MFRLHRESEPWHCRSGQLGEIVKYAGEKEQRLFGEWEISSGIKK